MPFDISFSRKGLYIRVEGGTPVENYWLHVVTEELSPRNLYTIILEMNVGTHGKLYSLPVVKGEAEPWKAVGLVVLGSQI